MTEKVAPKTHLSVYPIEMLAEQYGESMPVIDPINPASGAVTLNLPWESMEETEGLHRFLRSQQPHPSLCMLYQAGRCRAHMQCNQIHADPAMVAVVRENGRGTRQSTCCRYHSGESEPSATSSSSLATTNGGNSSKRTVTMVTFSGSHVAIPLDRTESTSYLERILSHASATGAPKAFFKMSYVCRLHQKRRCGYARQCGHVHICREYWQQLFVMYPFLHYEPDPSGLKEPKHGRGGHGGGSGGGSGHELPSFGEDPGFDSPVMSPGSHGNGHHHQFQHHHPDEHYGASKREEVGRVSGEHYDGLTPDGKPALGLEALEAVLLQQLVEQRQRQQQQQQQDSLRAAAVAAAATAESTQYSPSKGANPSPTYSPLQMQPLPPTIQSMLLQQYQQRIAARHQPKPLEERNDAQQSVNVRQPRLEYAPISPLDDGPAPPITTAVSNNTLTSSTTAPIVAAPSTRLSSLSMTPANSSLGSIFGAPASHSDPSPLRSNSTPNSQTVGGGSLVTPNQLAHLIPIQQVQQTPQPSSAAVGSAPAFYGNESGFHVEESHQSSGPMTSSLPRQMTHQHHYQQQQPVRIRAPRIDLPPPVGVPVMPDAIRPTLPLAGTYSPAAIHPGSSSLLGATSAGGTPHQRLDGSSASSPLQPQSSALHQPMPTTASMPQQQQQQRDPTMEQFLPRDLLAEE